jgi:hypothetical protein
MSRSERTVALLASLALAAAPLLAGCGSSKPSYCSAITNLENSIKALPSTNVLTSGVNGLRDAFTKVQNDAKTVISDAKNDFPTETSALQSSINALASTVKQVAANPSPSTITQILAQASAVVTAVNNFKSATSSKCK